MTATTTKLYRAMAAKLSAIRNCKASGNAEWEHRHGEALSAMVELLPSGGGIDNGTKLDVDACTETKIVLSCGFHHMNDHGYYDGWTEHTIIVTPSFDGIDIRVTGRDRNQIKDYLAETYHYALTQDVQD